MSASAPFTTQSRQLRLAIVIPVLAGALACDGARDVTAPTYRPMPVAMNALRAEVLATVDLETGTMTFEPIASGAGYNSASGVSAAIYGNQGVTVRLYNTPVVVSASPTPGKKLFSAMVGVRNMLSYPIGDEQGGAAPLDTIGIDVFMVQEPVVTSTFSPCSPACTITMRDHDGLRSFTAPNQKYWHWHDRLDAFGTPTDTTRTRKPFTFEADTQVRNFSFTVVLNAPWPSPYETRYKVEYDATALPTASTSAPWKLVQTTGANAPTVSDGLVLDPQTGSISYYRLDSIGQTQSAYFAARIQMNNTSPQNSNEAEARFLFVDGTKYIAIGVFSSGVGFVNSANALVGTKYSLVTSTAHDYQLRKYAADSAVLYVDGTRRGKMDYAALPASPYGTETRVEFGAINAKKLTTSTWWSVSYEIGVPTP